MYYNFWWFFFFLHEFIQTRYEALQASSLGQNATVYQILLDKEESPQCETTPKCPMQTHADQVQPCRLKQGKYDGFLVG